MPQPTSSSAITCLAGDSVETGLFFFCKDEAEEGTRETSLFITVCYEKHEKRDWMLRVRGGGELPLSPLDHLI